MRQRTMTAKQVQRAIALLSSLVEVHNEVVPFPDVPPQSDDWDEPLWSVRRLWGAWRHWLLFTAIDQCTESLWHTLRYFRRGEAEERERGSK